MTTNPQQPYPYLNFETVTPSLQVGWICEGQIIVFVPSDSARATIDAWLDSVISHQREWPSDKPLVALQDLSNPRIAVTPYARQRIKELGVIRHIAMLVNQTQLSMILAYVVNYMGNPKNFTTQVFFKQEAAVQWLLARAANMSGQQNSK
jgi:hypothetical protein